MPIFSHRLPSLVVLASLLLAAWAAQASAQQRPFAHVVDGWNQSLDLAAGELRQGSLPEERSEHLRENLSRVRGEALEVKAAADEALGPLREKLAALGPPPAEDEPPELDRITVERRTLAEAIALEEGRIKQAELTLRRLDELSAELRSRSIDTKLEQLKRRLPGPLAPDTLSRAVPELLSRVSAVAASPWVWWRDLSSARLDESHFFVLLGTLAAALAVALILRWLALRRFGRKAAEQAPLYSRRFYAGLAEGIADGIVPALILGAVWARVEFGPLVGAEVITGKMAEAIRLGALAGMFFFLARAMAHAVLAPDLPAWRLVPLMPENAKRIGLVIVALAAVAALDFWFAAVLEIRQAPDAARSVYLMLASLAEAGGILLLVPGRLWRADPDFLPGAPRIEGEARRRPGRAAARFWQVFRFGAGLIALAAICGALLGYANLAAYLAQALLLSGLVLSSLFLLRGLFREFIGAALRSRFSRETLEFQHSSRQLLKFWLRVLLDILLAGGGIILVLPLWGVPLADIWEWTWATLQGITVGNVTVSITDILAALLVFAVAVLVTRVLKRALSDKVLPRISTDTGVQHSLAAGFGYLGLIIAGALAVGALGLDLTNLALIFGALSVGIGFGLQNVANNLVSGLILLIERPVKAGDWVVVGTNEGFVKRIRLRATEVETFQKASILIPNSEIMSQAIVNWTYKDRYGRVDVPIHVAYDSDIKRVIEILEGCLRADEEIVDWPAPEVLFRRLGESALEFEARGFIANIEWVYQVRSRLLTAMYPALREAGIQIPFPQRDLHIKNADQLSGAVPEAPLGAARAARSPSGA